MAPPLSLWFLDTQQNLDNGLTLNLVPVRIVTYSQMHRTPRQVHTTQLENLASLATSLSVRLRTRWLWVRILLLSLELQIWHLLRARSFLTFRQTIECGFTLKLVLDMIKIYSQMHCTDKYSQRTSIISPVGLNGWKFRCELSGCGF